MHYIIYIYTYIDIQHEIYTYTHKHAQTCKAIELCWSRCWVFVYHKVAGWFGMGGITSWSFIGPGMWLEFARRTAHRSGAWASKIWRSVSSWPTRWCPGPWYEEFVIRIMCLLRTAQVSLLDRDMTIHGEEMTNTIRTFRSELEEQYGEVWPWAKLMWACFHMEPRACLFYPGPRVFK